MTTEEHLITIEKALTELARIVKQMSQKADLTWEMLSVMSGAVLADEPKDD